MSTSPALERAFNLARAGLSQGLAAAAWSTAADLYAEDYPCLAVSWQDTARMHYGDARHALIGPPDVIATYEHEAG